MIQGHFQPQFSEHLTESLSSSEICFFLIQQHGSLVLPTHYTTLSVEENLEGREFPSSYIQPQHTLNTPRNVISTCPCHAQTKSTKIRFWDTLFYKKCPRNWRDIYNICLFSLQYGALEEVHFQWKNIFFQPSSLLKGISLINNWIAKDYPAKGCLNDSVSSWVVWQIKERRNAPWNKERVVSFSWTRRFTHLISKYQE